MLSTFIIHVGGAGGCPLLDFLGWGGVLSYPRPSLDGAGLVIPHHQREVTIIPPPYTTEEVAYPSWTTRVSWRLGLDPRVVPRGLGGGGGPPTPGVQPGGRDRP